MNLCEPEMEFFNKYNKALTSYMRAVGTDLTCDIVKNKKESSCHVVMDLLNSEPCPILVALSDFSTNFYQVSKLNIINKRNLLPEEPAHTMVPKPSMPLMAQLLTPHVLIKIHMKSHLLRHFVIIPRLSSISQTTMD